MRVATANTWLGAMQRYGSRIQQVMLSNEWYRENMPRYKAAFEDGKIVIPQDAEVLADHRSLVMDDGVVHVPERRMRSGSGQRHGDWQSRERWRFLRVR